MLPVVRAQRVGQGEASSWGPRAIQGGRRGRGSMWSLEGDGVSESRGECPPPREPAFESPGCSVRGHTPAGWGVHVGPGAPRERLCD